MQGRTWLGGRLVGYSGPTEPGRDAEEGRFSVKRRKRCELPALVCWDKLLQRKLVAAGLADHRLQTQVERG